MVRQRQGKFDFLDSQKNQADDMARSTPSISHIYALESKLDDIFSEGIDARHARHAKLNGMVHDWVRERGFEFFAAEGYRSKSLTCVKNNRNIDVAALNQKLREKYHCVIDGGYGKIKGKTFRISNMGDETEETINQLLTWLNNCLSRINCQGFRGACHSERSARSAATETQLLARFAQNDSAQVK